jgi:predicted amidohydrolase
MQKNIRIAAVQMDARPAPTMERLAQAEKLVVDCAQAGAQLVVLPEVFNSGYEYSDANYARAESFDGPTAGWMRSLAAQRHIHLAGSFLRRQQDKIYNTLLLVAPDGRQWHYDKIFPWFWERAYFEAGSGISIADTDLGKIGFLVCWDVAHVDLWRQYAGKLDLMMVSSCPPKVLDLALSFPQGQGMRAAQSGALVQYLKRTTDETFGLFLRRQAAWLGVPVVNTTGAGTFATALPAPKRSLSMIAMLVPPVWKYRAQFEQARIESGYFNESYVADASGTVLNRVAPDVNGYAISQVTLPDALPQPKGKQPAFGFSGFAYLLDWFVNNMLAAEYRKKRWNDAY